MSGGEKPRVGALLWTLVETFLLADSVQVRVLAREISPQEGLSVFERDNKGKGKSKDL